MSEATTTQDDAELADQAGGGRMAAVARQSSTPMACFNVATQCCTEANAAFAALFATSPRAMIGVCLANIFEPASFAQIEPHLRHDAPNGADERIVDLSLRTQDGQVRDFDVSLVRYANRGAERELCLWMHEVTRFRATVRMAHEAMARLHRFMDASTEGIVFQRAGIIVDINPALTRLLGHAAEDVIGRPSIGFISPDDRDIVIGHISKGVEGRPYEIALLHSEGYEIPVEVLGRNVEFDGETLRMTLVRDIRARRAAEQRMRELAERDGLTGLYNRRVFLDQLPTRIAGLAERRQTAALLFIDLDRFKQVNDRHGHAQGDRLLQAAGQEILAFLTPGDIAGRMGGDEFAVLLTGIQPEAAGQRAHALLERVQAAFDATGLSDLAYASIGVALFPGHAQDANTLRRQADEAMYLAKAGGGSGIRLYAPVG